MSHNSSQGHVEENILLTQSLGFTEFISVLRQEAAQEMHSGLCTERDLNPIQNTVREPGLTCVGAQWVPQAQVEDPQTLRVHLLLCSGSDNISLLCLTIFILTSNLRSQFFVFTSILSQCSFL